MNQYVGLPYERGSDGPYSYDCWGLVCAIAAVPPGWKQRDASYLAIAKAFVEGVNSGGWRQLPEPFNGCIVGLGRSKKLQHAGVWVDGKVLHADAPGVCLQSLSTLRRIGWRRLEFYEWINADVDRPRH